MTTFVTALLNIYTTPYDHRSIEWRIERLKEILVTGITVFIFVSPDIYPLICDVCGKYSNLSIFRILSIQETEIWKLWSGSRSLLSRSFLSRSLPSGRRPDKDTIEYLCLMNAKVEMLAEVIESTNNNNGRYAWIDCNISHIFSEANDGDNSVYDFLSFLHKCKMKPGIFMPGCWQPSDAPIDTNNVCWRFCGGLFFGDATSLLTMKANWTTVCQTISPTWEVNVWAIMEQRGLLSVNWYSGDHNTTILTGLPTWSYSAKVGKEVDSWKTVEYPYIENYRTSAISHCQNVINVRMVNYYILENGSYYYPDGTGKIRNINFVAVLDEQGLPSRGFTRVIEELGLVSKEEAFSQGLEDIRLYSDNGELKFIASTANYSDNGTIQIVIGDYDEYLGKCTNGQIIRSEQNEKNWIPIQVSSEPTKFIYGWNPYQLIDDKKTLVFNEKGISLGKSIRGSTIFMPYLDGLLGMVHFSEQPPDKCRHYYHMFVLLDSDHHIKKWSQPFHFYQEPGIEFCIGIGFFSNELWCWVSHFDRDPCVFSMEKTEIESLWIL